MTKNVEHDFASPVRLALARHARPLRPVIAIVLPVYNEEHSVLPFFKAMEPIQKRLADQSCSIRYIFVNDGSCDQTLEVLFPICAARGDISILDFSRNFGKEAALTAGISAAVQQKVDAIVPMDVDLQDPPELIVQMVERWRQGYQIVLARRNNRSSDTWRKAISALIFYRLFNASTRETIPENVGDYRLMDHQVAASIGYLGERGRMMKALMNWVGYTRTYISFTRVPRQQGRTAFNAISLFRLGMSGILSFSTAPLRAILMLGLTAGLGAFIYGLSIILRTVIFGIDVPGYASTLVTILIAAALQLTTLGIVGEYIARLFQEVKARPHFIVSQQIDGDTARRISTQLQAQSNDNSSP